jgi:hypothetical protein
MTQLSHVPVKPSGKGALLTCCAVLCCAVCVTHAGEECRVRSAKLILERLADITGGTPAILVGDLNAGVC